MTEIKREIMFPFCLAHKGSIYLSLQCGTQLNHLNRPETKMETKGNYLRGLQVNNPFSSC